jgi:hypothetical protein
VIDGNELKTAVLLDFETQSTYQIRVQAADAGGLSVEQTVTIQVLDEEQERPTAVSLTGVSVAEDAPLGTAIGQLSAVDPNADDTHTFLLVGGEGDADNAAFVIDDDELQTAVLLDFEAQSTYRIRVRATDQGGLGVEQVFVVDVTNVNEAPTDVAVSSEHVAENSDAGTVVGQLSAGDPDAGDTHTFALVAGEGDTDNAAFVIDGDELRTAVSLDFEAQSTYHVRVQATDAGGSRVKKPLAITVTDVNEPPTAVLWTADSVSENAAVGTVIGQLSADDPDVGDSHTFALVSGEGDTDNAAFVIDGNELKTAVLLDFETQSTYQIRVQAADAGGLSVEQTVAIDVACAQGESLPVNHAPTVARSLSDVTVGANSPATLLDVGDVFADEDVATNGDSIRWEVASSNPSLVSTSLNGPLLLLTYAADSNGTATVTVTATDGQGASVADAFEVTVNAPTPAIGNISAVEEGSATVTVRGEGFVRGAAVVWEGVALDTTFVNSTELRAALSAATVGQEGRVADVCVSNPAPGGGLSDVVAVTVSEAVLQVTLQPVHFMAGLAYSNVAVATFTHGAAGATENDYQAVIDWGDGFRTTASAANGTIVRTDDSSSYRVLGTHLYQQAATAAGLPFSVRVQYVGGSLAPFTATQMPDGGPSDAGYQRGTHTLTRAIVVAHLAKLVAAGGVYSPANSGPIESLAFAYDFRVLSGPSATNQVGVGLLVKQGYNYYAVDYHGVGQDGWCHRAGSVGVSDFVKLLGPGPITPDFTAAGAPLEFGYFTANSTSGVRESLTWGLANLQLTINDTEYADRTFQDSDWTHLVLVADDLGGAQDVAQTTILVADWPLTLTVEPPEFIAGQAYENVTVATFTDANLATAAGRYKAVIDWGDGFITTASTVEGTIVRMGDVFSILGSHVYARAASDLTFTVRVHRIGLDNDPAELDQVLSGSPSGGPYQQGRLTFTSAAYVANISRTVGTGGVYDPGADGAISSLSYSYDFQTLQATGGTADQIGVGVLVKQGYNYYLADYHGVGQDGWSHSAGVLQAADFARVWGSGPSQPDFSSSGAPIEIGYLTAHSCDGWQWLTWGIADFRIAVNATSYADDTFREADWIQIVLWSDDLGAAQETRAAVIAVAASAG